MNPITHARDTERWQYEIRIEVTGSTGNYGWRVWANGKLLAESDGFISSQQARFDVLENLHELHEDMADIRWRKKR